jgi:hypothetical protein
MPACNPGSLTSDTNPSTGHPVIMDPFSGPLGSPFDTDTSGNCSTGALSTGIGFGLDSHVKVQGGAQIADIGVADSYIPGVTMPDGTTAATLATLLLIGGGYCDATDIANDGIATPNPYAVQAIGAFGNTQPRDGGGTFDDPDYVAPFQAFGMKIVTAAADVAAAGVIETGYKNYTGQTLKQTFSQFGGHTTANSAITTPT